MKISHLVAACVLGASAIASSTAIAAYSLSPYQNFVTGSEADAVAVGDINGDGRDDVALTTTFSSDPSNDYKLFVFFQQANGTLAAPFKYSYLSGAFSTGLALADLDHDGRMDIVVGHDQGITVLHWNPVSRKSPMQSRLYATALDYAAQDVIVVDVNRDGAPDVVGLSAHDGLTVYFGDGHGAISRQHHVDAIATGGNDLEAGDFNGDGHVDVVALSGANFIPAYVFYNDGTDDMSAPVEVDPNPGMDENSGVLGAGDFDGDGRTDLVAMRDPSSLSVMLQDVSGGLHAPFSLASTHYPNALVGADLDLDGRDDLVSLEGGGWLGLYMQGGQGLSAETLLTDPYGTWFNTQGLAVGDVNGDSCPDIVTANYNYGLVINAGNGCNAVADVGPSLGLTSSIVALRIDNFGAASAAAPDAVVDLALLNGNLSLGTLPAGCTEESHTNTSARIHCIGAGLAAATSRTVLLPIGVIGGDTRNALTATARVSTTSLELRLGNNTARGVLRGLSLAAAPIHAIQPQPRAH